MPVTLKDDQGTSASTAAAFADATQLAEFAAVDNNTTPTATAAFWLLLKHDGGTAHVIHVPADTVYQQTFRRGQADAWTWQVAAVSGTADITCCET